jgi:hypothetical protein
MALVDVVAIDELAKEIKEEVQKNILEDNNSRTKYDDKLCYIKSIDGVECCVIVRINSSHRDTIQHLELHIKANNVEPPYCEDGFAPDDDYPEYRYFLKKYKCDTSQEKIAISIRQMLKDLSELEFDRSICRFVTQQQQSGPVKRRKLFISASSTFDKIVCKMDKCCVCIEETRATTECNHHLCIPCADKIVPNQNGMRSCPICRQSDVKYMHMPDFDTDF